MWHRAAERGCPHHRHLRRLRPCWRYRTATLSTMAGHRVPVIVRLVVPLLTHGLILRDAIGINGNRPSMRATEWGRTRLGVAHTGDVRSLCGRQVIFSST